MLSLIGFYLFGLLGFGIHLLFKVKDEPDGLDTAWKYLKANQVKATLSLLTYTVLYGMWAGGAIKPLAEFPMWFTPALAYLSDSIWIHLIGVVEKKVRTA